MTEPAIHASCVAIGGHGVLVTGDSGTGKSSLALQLIDAAGYGTRDEQLRARLVGDDQVHLQSRDGRVEVRGAARLAGLIEVRNVGLVSTSYQASALLGLVVELCRTGEPDRLPQREAMWIELCGHPLPLLRLKCHDPLAPVKVRTAMCEIIAGRGLGS